MIKSLGENISAPVVTGYQGCKFPIGQEEGRVAIFKLKSYLNRKI